MSNELYHYGVPGMKWGRRKIQRYSQRENISRESAKEWREIGKAKSDRLKARGHDYKAYKVQVKYNEKAKRDSKDASKYAKKLKVANKEQNFRSARAKAANSRSRGARVATNILSGPYANRTYESVIAGGGSKRGARAVTAAAGLLGPVGHLLVSRSYTKRAGRDGTPKRF